MDAGDELEHVKVAGADRPRVSVVVAHAGLSAGLAGGCLAELDRDASALNRGVRYHDVVGVQRRRRSSKSFRIWQEGVY